jgi:hypothetical protein
MYRADRTVRHLKPYKMRLIHISLPIIIVALFFSKASAQQKESVDTSLGRHDFLYTGEWDHRRDVQTIFLIRNGKVKWTYDIPFYDSTKTMEELGDASMRANGNIVFCRKVGASEVTPEKKIIWNVNAPPHTEIHSVQPIGSDKVLYVLQGVPSLARLVNIKTGKVEKEWILPTGKPAAHLQFRRVSLLPNGNLLAAHLDSNTVTEYNPLTKPVWSFKVNAPWSARRLKGGNTLISNFPHAISEVTPDGKIVWQLNQEDMPEIKLYIIQGTERLPNGNTVFANWVPGNLKKTTDWQGTVQLVEVTPQKKVVWALSQWHEPDLGPASSFQLLDTKILDKIPAYR